MPADAYALVGLFGIVSLLCGVAATWLVGPRRAAGVIIPTLGAFLVLYWIGHRSGLELGPTVELLGFRVAIVQDVVAAAVGALVAAVGQRWVLARLRARQDPESQAR